MKLSLQENVCDPARLEAFLRGELSDLQERAFTLHLNSCETCPRALADKAAEPEVWREAEQLLRPSQFASGDSSNPAPNTRQPPQIQSVLDALGPTDDPAKLGRLGGYEVSGVVGAGGMGVVLKASDPSLDRTVAIKVLAPHLATSGTARKRFAREAKAAAAVLHPNVIAIHSVSNHESLPYLVMPYVRGTSLQKRLDQEGPLPLQELLRIGAQVAAGLAAAHGQGLVHRDIKPANILLEDGVERVTITDFGLARAVDDATITHCGMIAGTPQFMSPEQARGEPVDQRSDLFSLGSVLYAICTGRPPFRAETSYGVMRRITDDEPISIRELNPEIPEWLCRIIGRLMSKQAAHRFASAAEVAELLEACLAHVQHPTSAPLPLAFSAPRKRRKYVNFSRRSGILSMIITFGLALLGMFAWEATQPPDIAGSWSGPEWGDVVLSKVQPGQYEGSYSDTYQKPPGKIEVKWSRLESRYKGTWREGQSRSGKISLRLVEDEIRGAWTTSKKSEINPGAPELADLTWKRTRPSEIGFNDFGTVLEREVRNREAIDFDTGKLAMIPDADRDPEVALLAIFEGRPAPLTEWMEAEKMDAVSEGSSFTGFGLKVKELRNADWDTLSPAKVRAALQIDWRKENPREFGIAFTTLDPQAPPHVILALRTQPRTIAFQTREGKTGIMQLVELTKVGFKVRFKLATIESQKQTTSYVLKYAQAENVVNTLQELIRTRSYAARVASDPRTNSVIVSGSENELQVLAARLTRLDVPTNPGNPWAPSAAAAQTPQLQLRIAAPEGMVVRIANARGDFDKSPNQTIPARLNLDLAETYRLKISNIPGREGTELYPSVETGEPSPRSNALLAHSAIPLRFTDEDLDQAIAGTLVIKAIYLPEAKSQELAQAGVETLVSTHLDPGTDPIEEAKRRGSLLAVVRLGNKDAEFPGTSNTANDRHFSEVKEVVLSMNSMKFMLDLDTGKTMDPPATLRPEQKLMDLHTDQVQPYHYPKELIGQGLRGLEVKEADWDATPADVRRALAGKDVTPLKQMDLGPEERPTYFFRTSDGATGVLQLLGITDDPRGIRLRYKTVNESVADEKDGEQPDGRNDFGSFRSRKESAPLPVRPMDN